ncbi:MAG TPA: hypothetical protein PLU72_11250 [Candidatus Ozemobacteraceae bacterium]|nr:hypothetical protein [Candidatus Ozemobacteraceae bacterium]
MHWPAVAASWIVCLAFVTGLWPAVALVAGFLGLDTPAERAWLLSPSAVVSDQRLDDAVTGLRVRRRLEMTGVRATVEGFGLVGRADPGRKELAAALATAAVEIRSRLGPIPFHPTVVLQELETSEGRFQDFFHVSVDPTRDEPVRVLAHELVHLHLLWALLPGFPVDCPRWFNEGMAEELSASITEGRLRTGKHNGFDRELIPPGALIPLAELAPAFSGDGDFIEVQARLAFSLLRDQVGEHGIRRVVEGLRRARPFRSVLQIVCGRSLERLEREYETLLRNRVDAGFLPPEEVVKRLEWHVEYRPGGRTVELVSRCAPAIGNATASAILEKIRLVLAEKCMNAGRPEEAAGWLAPLARAGVPETRERLETARLAAKRASASPAEPLPPRPVRNEGAGWILSFGLTFLLVVFYRRMRVLVAALVDVWWKSRSAGALTLRWVTLLGSTFGAAWLLRLLTVGFLPYAGVDVGDDRGRIILAEALVVISWLALARTFGRIGGADGVAVRETLMQTSSRRYDDDTNPVTWGVLCVSAWIPAMAAATFAGWERTENGFSDLGLTILINITAGLAFWTLFGRVTRTWPGRNAGGGAWWIAFAYALFRSGLGGDPGAWVAALGVGRRLAGVNGRFRSVFSAVALDLAWTAPHIVLVCGWFPAQDPIGGLFLAAPPGILPWILPVLAAWWPVCREHPNDASRK